MTTKDKVEERITIRDVENDYGVNFNEKRNMLLSTWLKKKGLLNMAKAIDKITNQ